MSAVKQPGADDVAEPLGEGSKAAPDGGERLVDKAADKRSVVMVLVADAHAHATVVFGRFRRRRSGFRDARNW